MLLDGVMEPFDAATAHYAKCIPDACRSVEQSMLHCLANPALEAYVNTAGVSTMLRDTLHRWSHVTAMRETASGVASADGSSLSHVARHECGAYTAEVLRDRMIQCLEDCWQRCAMMEGSVATGPALSEDVGEGEEGSRSLPVALMRDLVRFASITYASLTELCRLPRGTVVLPLSAAEPDRREELPRWRQLLGVQPSPTYEVQLACTEALSRIRSLWSLHEAPQASPFTAADLAVLHQLLLNINHVAEATSEIAQEAVVQYQALEHDASTKLRELIDMAQWYDASVAAASAWNDERHRRAEYDAASALRVEAIQRALDAAADEEDERRRAFGESHLPYLPKSAYQLQVLEKVKERYRIVRYLAPAEGAPDRES